MNVNQSPRQVYQPGEVRLSTTSPGIGWVEANGKLIRGPRELVSRLNKAGYVGFRERLAFAIGVQYNIRAQAYGPHNNRWVVFDDGGQWHTSDDHGNTWTYRSSSATDIRCATCANGTFVYGGGSGRIYYSTTALTWTKATSNFGTSTVNGVAYGNGIWVAVGTGGTIRRSTDAITWTTQTSNFGTVSINGVAYGNGVFVAVASSGAGSTIRASTDGITWTTQTSPLDTTGLQCVHFGGDRFLIGPSTSRTALATSTDGLNWTTTPFCQRDGSINAIGYGNGLWITTQNGGFAPLASRDLVTWVTVMTDNISGTGWSVLFANSTWVLTSGFMVHTAKPIEARLPFIDLGDGVRGWIKT